MADSAVKIPFTEAAAPSTPAASKVVIYAKSDGLMYSKDDAGTETLMSGGVGGGGVATDPIWDAAGDLAVGSGANTAARLAIGATNGMALMRVGGVVAWGFPKGYAFDVGTFTAPVSITATTEATANQIVTGAGFTFDGSTSVRVRFYCPMVTPQPTNGIHLQMYLYDGSSSIGIVYQFTHGGTSQIRPGAAYFETDAFTPSAAAHTYSIRGVTGSGTGTITAGVGGAGAFRGGWMEVVKA